MQQLFNCQQMVKAIRNTIRKEAENLTVPKKPGFIKISLVPYTKDADEQLGGFSDVQRSFPEKPIPEDFVVYEYTYALDPKAGLSSTEKGSYVNIGVKHRRLLTRNTTDGVEGSAYIFEDYLDVMVRVSGTDDKNKFLAQTAFDVVNSVFAERSPDFSVKLD